MYVMSSELYGAASLNQRGPTLSVPVALLVSMAESSFDVCQLLNDSV